MAEFLYSIDKSLLYFCNSTLANQVFDVAMPFLTDLNKMAVGKILYVALWILLMWKGGKKGRIIGLLLIPLITLSDQLSSSVLKKLIERPRPCHYIDGVRIVEHLRLLVDCGSGYSFPSSHAVNNFAAATFFSYYYRKWITVFFSIAGIIGFSRIYVGVHYPADVFCGAVVGVLCAALVIIFWGKIVRRFPNLALTESDMAKTGA